MPTIFNPAVPGHNDYLTTTYGGKSERWNAAIIGRTDPMTYDAILAHESFAYSPRRRICFSTLP